MLPSAPGHISRNVRANPGSFNKPSRGQISERLLARVGTVVRQKYRVARLLGVGGMAAVYAAEDAQGRHVAMKFVLEHLRDDPEIVRLFKREAFVVNQVGHQGAVAVLDHDIEENGCAFLVMPLLDGETFRARWERSNRSLPVAEAAVLMDGVLDVLACAHAKGIIHRDIKPENLFVTTAGEVRVLDFGIARHIDGTSSGTLTGRMMGTPGFIAPEQALGDRAAIGPASDCWSAGATLFTLLSGELVHPADGAQAQLVAAATRHARSLASAVPHLPACISAFVDRALAFEPKDRWADAREMRAALHTAFATALGEDLESVSARVRASLAADMRHEASETLGRGASATPVSAARRKLAMDPGIEVRVGPRIFNTFQMMPAIVQRIFAEHGFGRFIAEGYFLPDLESWWPMDRYVACLHAVSDAVDPAELRTLSKKVAKYSDFPKSAGDTYKTLESLDVLYHLDHRKDGQVMFNKESSVMMEGIGHIRYRGEPRFIVMEYETPYPCATDFGMLISLLRHSQPGAGVEHAPGACRQHGDTSCAYHVRW